MLQRLKEHCENKNNGIFSDANSTCQSTGSEDNLSEELDPDPSAGFAFKMRTHKIGMLIDNAFKRHCLKRDAFKTLLH